MVLPIRSIHLPRLHHQHDQLVLVAKEIIKVRGYVMLIRANLLAKLGKGKG